MSDDEPHKVEDNAPLGEQAETNEVIKRFRLKSVIVQVGFDEHQKELELWDYLYDVKTEKFEMTATTDYKNRIQYYEISADHTAIRKFKSWLIEKEIKFKHKFDK